MDSWTEDRKPPTLPRRSPARSGLFSKWSPAKMFPTPPCYFLLVTIIGYSTRTASAIRAYRRASSRRTPARAPSLRKHTETSQSGYSCLVLLPPAPGMGLEAVANRLGNAGKTAGKTLPQHVFSKTVLRPALLRFRRTIPGADHSGQVGVGLGTRSLSPHATGSTPSATAASPSLPFCTA
jgi:hypothetical protein